VSKIKNYFLIVRDRETNHFEIIDFNNSKEYLLEEIDNYTSNFTDNKSLIKNIKEKGYNVSDKSDIYIVQRKKENGQYIIKTQEVLHNSAFLKRIIEDSLAGYYDEESSSVTEEEKEKARVTASHLFMWFFGALKDKDIINFAIKDNHFPRSFRDYLYNTPYNEKYDVRKLQRWQFGYYPLLRNLLPYIIEKIKLDNPYERKRYESDLLERKKIEDEIIERTDKKYDSNQYSFFDEKSDWYLGDKKSGVKHVKRR